MHNPPKSFARLTTPNISVAHNLSSEKIRDMMMGGRFTRAVPREVTDKEAIDRRAREMKTISGKWGAAVTAGKMVVSPGRLPDLSSDDVKNLLTRKFVEKTLRTPFEGWFIIHEAAGPWNDQRGMIFACRAEEESLRCVQMEPVNIGGVSEHACLMIADEIVGEPDHTHPGNTQFWAHCYPSDYREYRLGRPLTEQESINLARYILCTTLYVCALLQDHPEIIRNVRPSSALNKSRERSGKHPLPPVTKVSPELLTTYVLRPLKSVQESQGGTHASPVPHIRKGHFRTIGKATGNPRKLWIGETVVNASKGEPVNRKFYLL